MLLNEHENLLEETLESLKENNKNPSDVNWVGSESFGWFTWNEFEKIAINIEYNNGYGTMIIAEDLVVVGDNWWLERHGEDTGVECWVFKTLPQKPKKHKIPQRIAWKEEYENEYYKYGYISLIELNNKLSP